LQPNTVKASRDEIMTSRESGRRCIFLQRGRLIIVAETAWVTQGIVV